MVFFDLQKYVDAVERHAAVTAEGFDDDIVGFPREFFVHVKAFADHLGRAGGVARE